MTDDQLLLASAYVDAEVTASEKAAAEADPEVMSEVERLRALQRDIADVPPASTEVRAAAISAALTAWSSTAAPTMNESGTAASVAEPTPITSAPSVRRAANRPSARWSMYSRLVGAAAAVFVVGLGAIVVTQRSNNVSRTDRGAAESPNPSPEPMAASASAAASGTSTDVDGATEGGAPELTDMGAKTARPENEPTVAAMDGSATDDAYPVTVTPLHTLEFTPEDLQRIVLEFREPESTGTSRSARPPTPTTEFMVQCDAPTPTAEIIGRTTAPNSDVERPVVALLITIDEPNVMSYAVDADTCLVVQAAELAP